MEPKRIRKKVTAKDNPILTKGQAFAVNSLHMLGPECCFSFADLFTAAEGRMWTEQEENVFKNLSQSERNDWVSRLAEMAPQFKTQDKVGSDGLIYRAFWVDAS